MSSLIFEKEQETIAMCFLVSDSSWRVVITHDWVRVQLVSGEGLEALREFRAKSIRNLETQGYTQNEAWA